SRLKGGFEIGDVLQHALRVLIEQLALLGGRHAAMQPYEQRRADEFLQPVNARRYQRLDRVQTVRGPAETARLVHQGEAVQIPEMEHGTPTVSFDRCSLCSVITI